MNGVLFDSDVLFDGRGPQRGCAARPACARTGMGTPEPHAGAALAGTAPAFLAGGGPPFGISRPFAPTLPTVQTARPPTLREVSLSALRPGCRTTCGRTGTAAPPGT